MSIWVSKLAHFCCKIFSCFDDPQSDWQPISNSAFLAAKTLHACALLCCCACRKMQEVEEARLLWSSSYCDSSSCCTQASKLLPCSPSYIWLIRFRTLLLWWIFYTSADLLVFVPLSRPLPPSSPPHTSPKISLAFLSFFGV